MQNNNKNYSLQDLEGEIWKDIESYESLYQVSNKKRIKALSKKRINKKGYVTFTKEKIIGLGKKVVFTKNGIEYSHNVQKLYDKYFFSNVNLEGEVWVSVKGMEDFYKISNLGRVKSLKRFIEKSNNRVMTFQEKILNQTKHSKNGYYSVALNDGFLGKRINVHRLVALHFLPLIEGKNEVNHIDSDKSNNKFDNLEWVNRGENQSHMSKNKNKTSKYIGVCLNKEGNFISYICFNSKRTRLGTFKTEEEAYKARKQFELDNNIINKYS
jgi:hypothetical protein